MKGISSSRPTAERRGRGLALSPQGRMGGCRPAGPVGFTDAISRRAESSWPPSGKCLVLLLLLRQFDERKPRGCAFNRGEPRRRSSLGCDKTCSSPQ